MSNNLNFSKMTFIYFANLTIIFLRIFFHNSKNMFKIFYKISSKNFYIKMKLIIHKWIVDDKNNY